MKPDIRKAGLLQIGLALAIEYGYSRVTRTMVANAAGLSGPVLNHYFGTMDRFRQGVMELAVEEGTLEVVAQGLAVADPTARAAPEALRRRALESLL